MSDRPAAPQLKSARLSARKESFAARRTSIQSVWSLTMTWTARESIAPSPLFEGFSKTEHPPRPPIDARGAAAPDVYSRAAHGRGPTKKTGWRVAAKEKYLSFAVKIVILTILIAGGVMTLIAKSATETVQHAGGKASSTPPTAEEGRKFVEPAENVLLALWVKQQRAQWVALTFITEDTEVISAEA